MITKLIVIATCSCQNKSLLMRNDENATTVYKVFRWEDWINRSSKCQSQTMRALERLKRIYWTTRWSTSRTNIRRRVGIQSRANKSHNIYNTHSRSFIPILHVFTIWTLWLTQGWTQVRSVHLFHFISCASPKRALDIDTRIAGDSERVEATKGANQPTRPRCTDCVDSLGSEWGCLIADPQDHVVTGSHCFWHWDGMEANITNAKGSLMPDFNASSNSDT